MSGVTVIGQQPPPFGGQSLQFEALLSAQLEGLRLFPVRLNFARSFTQSGRVTIGAVRHTVLVVARALWFRVVHGVDTFYMQVSGADARTLIRDLFVIALLRLSYRKAVYHFQSAGLIDYLSTLRNWQRNAALKVLQNPTVAIGLPGASDSAELVNPRTLSIVSNGVRDAFGDKARRQPRNHSNSIRLLYVGLVAESKGVLRLIETAKLLVDRGYDVQVLIAGESDSEVFRLAIGNMIQSQGLESRVSLVGVVQGEEKTELFLWADVFVFLSSFKHEASPMAIIEAMSSGLPVVASNWRGIPALVDHESSGFIIPDGTPKEAAERLAFICDHPNQWLAMSRNARERYIQHYTEERSTSAIRESLVLAVNGKRIGP